MNYVRQQDKMLRGFAAFVAAMVVLNLAGAGIPVQAQIPTTIYTFTGNGNPANPLSSAVAQGRDGNYYFATCIPATLDSVLFNISPSGTLTTVYTPINCTPGPTVGTDGNFYSVVNDLSCCGNTLGEIYKVTPTGTATILYTFTGGADGADPNTPPIEGTNGIFYGVTTSNHVPDSTAYSVTSGGVFTTLHTFTGTWLMLACSLPDIKGRPWTPSNTTVGHRCSHVLCHQAVTLCSKLVTVLRREVEQAGRRG